MPDDKNPDSRESHEIVLDQFLLDTIISLQTTLTSLDKDAGEKSDMIGSISDNLKAIAFGMKEMREKTARLESDQQAALKIANELSFKVEALAVKIESEVNTHVKEIKYTAQQIKDDLVEIKIEAKVAKKTPAKYEDDDEDKKFTVASFFSNLWEAIKNIKTILMILLGIALVLGAIINGQPIIDTVVTPIIKMFSGS